MDRVAAVGSTGALILSDLIRRARAVDATKKKYGPKVFNWRQGSTCIHMARSHLVQMGHRPPSLPRIRSLLSARKALKESGWANVEAMLDAQAGLIRIAPAEMLLGDIAVLASEDGIGAIFICAGPHKLIGWREDHPTLVVLDLSFDQISGAWRA